MSEDDLDSQFEKNQFEELYQQKLGMKMEKKTSENYENSLQRMVNEIIKNPKERQRKKPINRRPKWDDKSNKLFFKLYDLYAGDLSMITQFFQEHTDYKFQQKQINRKYNQEVKKDPEALIGKPKQNIIPKIDQKLKQFEEDAEPSLRKQISKNEFQIQQIGLISQVSMAKKDSTQSLDSVDKIIHKGACKDFNKIINQYTNRK